MLLLFIQFPVYVLILNVVRPLRWKVAALVLIIVIHAVAVVLGMRTHGKWSIQEVVLTKQENPKYQLTAIFYGERGPEEHSILSRIALRNDRTGDELAYEPEEPFWKNYTQNVWSPDGEFLLLMRGWTNGICIIKASEAENEIKSHSCYDFIRVYEKSTGFRLGHSFGAWTNNDEFHFSAESGDSGNFTYNLKTRQLKVTGSDKNFEGENLYGKVPLSE